MQKYESAVSAYESEEYDQAQRLFIEIRDYLDSADYLNKIGDSFYTTATDLFNSGDYVTCGDYLLLVDTADEWGRYSEAIDLFNQARDIYYNQTAEEAKNICRSQGETEMRSYVSGKKCSILSDADIEQLKNACMISRINLADLNPYISKGVAIDNQVEDNFGNIYEVAMNNDVGTDWGDAYLTYDIGGNYKYLYATIACIHYSGSNFSDGIVKVFGDDRLLWGTNTLGVATKPYEIEVDISGVTDLRIEVYGHYGINSKQGTSMFCTPILTE